MGKLERQIEALATSSPAQLREEWQGQFGAAAPALPLSLIRRALAYRLQEQQLGHLPSATQRVLDMLATSTSTQLPEPPIQLKSGTRLLREWNGRMHAVLVTDDGFSFEERRYSSLSHIAREITGAHWSGPRFFGLKRREPPKARGGASG
ncbi:DUF2924 domain-containing protein [Sphingomonas sp. ID0503]|uniref:DUF2924 domain-containing protein n=1 Tax=Sphingomonas sp. ID0503 TaxID=3399691 RepID=UPI003AFA6F5D